MLLTRDIAEATYEISTDKHSASAVGVEARGHHCLITARHLFKKERNLQINGPETKIEPKCSKVNVCITNAISPLPAFSADVYCNNYYDVAVVDIPQVAADNMKEKGAKFLPLHYLSDAGVGIGTDVLLVGFPFIWESNDIGIKNPDKRNGFFVPLIKSGSFCSFQPENGAYELIDVHNNAGFSGGPVVWQRNGKSYVLGTVCGYYFDKIDGNIIPTTNSGFAEICAIGHARDLIQYCVEANSK